MVGLVYVSSATLTGIEDAENQCRLDESILIFVGELISASVRPSCLLVVRLVCVRLTTNSGFRRPELFAGGDPSDMVSRGDDDDNDDNNNDDDDNESPAGADIDVPFASAITEEAGYQRRRSLNPSRFHRNFEGPQRAVKEEGGS